MGSCYAPSYPQQRACITGPVVGPTRDADRGIEVADDAALRHRFADLGAVASIPIRPMLEVGQVREQVGLVAVAAGVSENQVVREVTGRERERHEVIDVAHCVHRFAAVEAPAALERLQHVADLA